MSFGAPAWLATSLICVAASAWMWSTRTLDRNIVGYLLSGIGATTCVALFHQADTAARASRNYEHRPLLTGAAVLLLLGSLGLAGLHIWPLAQEWSKQ